MTSAKILIVDDEPQIRRVLRTTLTSQGYTVAEARTGDEALEQIRSDRPDLILLDVNMPGISGLETCREIRASSDIPIIMLTVRGTERDKVQALDAGADDYVVKPFGSEELMARIRAGLRRAAPAESLPPFVSTDLKIDFEKRSVSVKGQPVRLTPKEFELLRHLVANQGKAQGHRRLLQAVWGPDYGEETEYLRVFINQLRKKIEPDPKNPRFIHTEPWVGYRFEPPAEKSRVEPLGKIAVRSAAGRKDESMAPPIIKPPFTLETAKAKVQAAEDAWNSRDPERVALAYTEDSDWRNRDEFFQGREAIKAFLRRKWAKELDYRLRKELWCWTENRIAVTFQYEWHNPSGPLVPVVRKRAVGIRRARVDAPADRQHQ